MIPRLPRLFIPALTGLLLSAACSDGGNESQPVVPGESATASAVPTGTPRTAYAAGWSAVHADGANTDYSPVHVGDDLRVAWEQRIEGSIRIGQLPWTINLGPTIDPSGRIYVTSSASGCHLRALDGETGELMWCDSQIDLLAVVSSPLIDQEGRLFIADGAGMHALSRDGRHLWDRTLHGVPLSAQFTPDGHLVFVTHVGTVYVLDRDDGALVLPPVELVPGVEWQASQGMMACARGTEACPSANTIAVDARGRVFFTLWEVGARAAGVRAMQYVGGSAPEIRNLWANNALPGGSASSPVLSADGRRIYVTDNVDSLHALDADTGAIVWSYPIGFASGGSASLSPEGLIMPAGGGQSPVLAVRDAGLAGELAWRRDDLLNRGIATQAAGGRAYVTVAAEAFENDFVVIDTATGAELDREHLSGTSVFSVGTTVGPDGTVFVATIVGGLHALRAVAR